MTIDQQGSRSQADLVPALIEQLNSSGAAQLAMPFERTAGDEVQGVMASAHAVVVMLTVCIRQAGWWIGIGAGEVDNAPATSARAGRGPAYIHARDAVERAKTAPYPVCVSADHPYTEYAETACWLLVGVLEGRSEAGWQAIDALAVQGRQNLAAEQLGISPQAISRRLRVAGMAEQERGSALAAHLLGALA